MAVDPHRLFMSVEEYLELDRNSLDARYEYIDGVVTMLAGGTTNHSRISVNMVSLLQATLRGSPSPLDARAHLWYNKTSQL